MTRYKKIKIKIIFFVFLFSQVGLIDAVTKTNGSTSGLAASSSATIKVPAGTSMKMNNGAITIAANARLEGITYLTNSILNKDGGINTTVKSGTVTDGAAVSINSSTINLKTSTISQPIAVSGNASFEGVPKNFTTGASDGIGLANSATVLNIAATSPIATNIALVGGTIKLDGTTKFADGKSTSGSGTIDCNGHSLQFGGSPLTLSSNLKIKKGADIQFYSTFAVEGQMLFDGDANICGNGNILDLSSGGTIVINPNTTLNMTDLTIKGLGLGHGFGLGHIMFNDTTSRLLLSDVEFCLSRDYTVSNGGIYVIGPTTIATADHLLNFSLNGSLTVDGVSLMYDTLSFPDNQNIRPTLYNDLGHKHITLLNNGVIRYAFDKTSQSSPLIDGSSTLRVFNNNYIFRKGGAGVTGFTRFGGGFTILPDASAVFDTFITVSGPIDLRETGTLILIDDLTLGSNVTLSSGGNIDGRGNTLFLGNDLILPNNKILHFMSNIKVDGCGHTLTIGDYSQLFVDDNATLTLHNLVLKSSPKTCVFPPVRCAGYQSCLALDNVMVDMSADIPFYQGALAISNDVVFTGTSTLVYNSSQQSSLYSGSTLTFDHGTTFSYAPSTDSKDLIHLQDATARIVLDGCTLKTTDTGLRLTIGSLLCDNKVMIDSTAGLYLSGLTSVAARNYGTLFTGLVNSLAWRPDGLFIAVAGKNAVNGSDSGFNTTDLVRVYAFDGTNLIPCTSVGYGTQVYALSWSPDGRYLVLGGNGPSIGGSTGFSTSDEIRVYSFDGASKVLTPVTSRKYGTSVYGTQWTSDGKYLAVSGYAAAGDSRAGFSNTDEIRIYTFNGRMLMPVTSCPAGARVYGLAWHSSDRYLAAGMAAPTSDGGFGAGNTDELRVYGFDGAELTPLVSKGYGVGSGYVTSVGWTSNGQSLAVAGTLASIGDTGINATDEFRIYNFNGALLTGVTSKPYGSGKRIMHLRWAPDGKTIIIVGDQPLADSDFPDINPLRSYCFDGISLIPVTSAEYPPEGGSVMWCDWHPAGSFFAAGWSNGAYGISPLVIFSVQSVISANPQALSNSLVFGNSALGSGADLDVKMLSSAWVEVRGQLLDDSV